MLYMLIVYFVTLQYIIRNAIITTTVKKHTFLGYLEALAGPCPRGLGRPVLGPSQKVPKIALFRAIITFYTLTCNHYIDIILQLHTIELRVLSVYHYISVLRLLLYPFPRAHKGLLSEGF